MGADGSQVMRGHEGTASRLSWIDYAKGIGICLVVYGHVARGVLNAGLVHHPETLWYIDSVIYSFHMPLFFVLAGLLFFDSSEKHGSVGFAFGKVDTLLYPYVLWSLLQGTIEIFMSSFTNHRASWSDVLGLVWEPRAQFWFLYALFFCSLAAVLVRHVFFSAGKEMIAAACVALGFWLYFEGDLPRETSVGRYLAGHMVYFSFGILLGLWKMEWRRFAIIFAAIFALLWVVAGLYDFEKSRSNAVLSGFFGLMVVVFVSKYLSRFNIRVLAHLGEYSLAIYLMHVLIGSGVRIALQRLFGVENLVFHLLLGSMAGIFVSYWMAKELVEKNVRWMFSVPSNHGMRALMGRIKIAQRA